MILDHENIKVYQTPKIETPVGIQYRAVVCDAPDNFSFAVLARCIRFRMGRVPLQQHVNFSIIQVYRPLRFLWIKLMIIMSEHANIHVRVVWNNVAIPHRAQKWPKAYKILCDVSTFHDVLLFIQDPLKTFSVSIYFASLPIETVRFRAFGGNHWHRFRFFYFDFWLSFVRSNWFYFQKFLSHARIHQILFRKSWLVGKFVYNWQCLKIR